MREDKVSIAIFRLTYGGREHPAIGSWLAKTMCNIVADSRVRAVGEYVVDKSPVYLARNVAAKYALGLGADLMVMVDNDMHPDYITSAPTFWKTAFDLVMEHDDPLVVVAPAQTGPPYNQVCIHTPVEEPDGKISLHLMEEVHAAEKAGIEQVPGSGTSLILIDTRVFKIMEPPWFLHLYNDDVTEIMSSEDVNFTAALKQYNIPLYVTWDSWQGHYKTSLYGRPQ